MQVAQTTWVTEFLALPFLLHPQLLSPSLPSPRWLLKDLQNLVHFIHLVSRLQKGDGISPALVSQQLQLPRKEGQLEAGRSLGKRLCVCVCVSKASFYPKREFWVVMGEGGGGRGISFASVHPQLLQATRAGISSPWWLGKAHNSQGQQILYRVFNFCFWQYMHSGRFQILLRQKSQHQLRKSSDS